MSDDCFLQRPEQTNNKLIQIPLNPLKIPTNSLGLLNVSGYYAQQKN